MTRFGKYGDSGVEVEADECVLTGRPLKSPFDNSVRYAVANAKLFYRVIDSQAHRVTDELRAQWEKEAKGESQLAVTSGESALSGRSRRKESEGSE